MGLYLDLTSSETIVLIHALSEREHMLKKLLLKYNKKEAKERHILLAYEQTKELNDKLGKMINEVVGNCL